MRMSLCKAFGITLVVLAAFAAPAAAATITFQDLGTAAPPATLGGFAMTPFPDDGFAPFDPVTSLPSPLGGTVDFSPTMMNLEVPSSWATWSHGYTGDVYWTQGATSVLMTLPAGTNAFYFYAEPNPQTLFNFMATAADGTSSPILPIDGNAGARGFGFYSPDSTIASILFSQSAAIQVPPLSILPWANLA
jgi:hypothetical protein